jgi:serine/threonine-protein kinase
MGAVYRGEQMSLKRKVAIKLLHPDLSADPGLVRRFNAEAELAARLSHPNTVNIYDFGQDRDGMLFIAMEFLEGRSLRQVVSTEGPLPVRRALHIAAQIAASIADAHRHGIVHRDLKPDNVMLTARGRDHDVVRVLDFGIAKLRDEQHRAQTASPMTRQGDLVGTPQYMAPEQIRGEAVDARTDVYALGTILYEMVTGRMPFEGPTLMAIMSKHLLEAAQAPTARRPDLGLPPGIDDLVLGMMAKAPTWRPASMDVVGEQIAQLAAVVGGAPTPPPATLPQAVRPPPVLPQATSLATPPPARASRLWLWIALAVAGLAVVAGAVIAVSGSGASDGAPRGEAVQVGGYRVVLPPGFVDSGSWPELDRGIEAHTYSGAIGGRAATLHLFATPEDLSSEDRDELDDGCGDIGRNYFSGQLNASHLVGRGAQRYRCTIGAPDQAIEGALYSGAAGTLIVFFAAAPDDFASLAGARDDLFDRRVTTSASSR